MAPMSNKEIRNFLFIRDGNRCAYCNKKLSRFRATLDHVIPISKKGSRYSLGNMVLSCRRCNMEKADKDVFEYMRTKAVSHGSNR